MSELEALLKEIEDKRAELLKAHEDLTRFKRDLDEGFRKLNYLRLRVKKLVNSQEIDKKVQRLIEEALNA
jgi:hypothetical protein